MWLGPGWVPVELGDSELMVKGEGAGGPKEVAGGKRFLWIVIIIGLVGLLLDDRILSFGWTAV